MAKLMHKDESYTGGGSSGLLPHIVITSDAENTITVTTPSGSTITPTSTVSGVWECDVDEYGTYTITATYDEHEAEDTVVVDTVKVYAVEIHIVTIPDGSTVLPTDDVATWLLCADIKDKSYTTLSQVLDDSETFNALLGDSNACAYMKRSTTFALQENLVPTMTGLTTPSGKCFGTMPSGNNLESFGAPNAFGKPSTYGYQTSSTPAILGYEFTSAEIVKKVYVKNLTNNSGQQPTQLVVKATNDEITINEYGTLTSSPTWTTLKTVSVSTLENVILIPENNAAYTAYAVEFMYSGQIQVGMLQFYTDVDITTNQYAMNLLGQYDTACDALLSDSTWASAIANSTYFESVLNVKVPAMTSNTTPEGEAFASSVAYSYYPWKAFNGSATLDANNMWGKNEADNDAYIGYGFANLVKIYKVEYYNNVFGADATKVRIKASADKSTFVNISDELNASTGSGVKNSFVVNPSTAYQYWIIHSPDREGNPWNVSRLQFYGRKSSGEKIHGGNPTYDSFYRIVDGNHVPVTDPSLLDAGTYTIYSNGLAKNPSDLTSDYGKTVRICPNTKEILVRPDIAPYWFGSKICNFVGTPYVPASGWDTCSGSVSEQNTYIQITCNLSSGAGMYALRTDRSFAFNGSQKLKAHIYDSSDTQYGNMDAKANISSNLAENGVSWTNDAVSETSALTAGSYYPYVAKRHGSSASSAKLDMLFIE